MAGGDDARHVLGHEAPILADGRRPPDRRDVSIRWLCGAFLTGLTSTALMGVALFAALDGREQLAIPAEAMAATDMAADGTSAEVERGGRVIGPILAAKPVDRTVMSVPTIIKKGDREVVRKRPFAHVDVALAAPHDPDESYPDFNPLNIFSEDGHRVEQVARTGLIYGAQIDSEVSLRTTDFPLEASPYGYASSMSAEEAEEIVRSSGSILVDGTTQVAALHYVDPRRFGQTEDEIDLGAGLAARILSQNLSIENAEAGEGVDVSYIEDVIPVRAPRTIAEILTQRGYQDDETARVADSLAELLQTSELEAGEVLRLLLQDREGNRRVVRASLYEAGQHVGSIALNDNGVFVAGSPPEPSAAVAAAFQDVPLAASSRPDLPTVYDGIYRAALSYGMTKEMVALLVRLVASSVDLQARLTPADRLEAFFSVDPINGEATNESELLYVDATFGDTKVRFYRFQNPEDGSVDYYDEQGRSVRQFLLRNPLPNGRFTSPFGVRRHPILGYKKMHTGVDWAAPRGTPIIASGNGVVLEAGWSSGYGKQTVIRHANGYVSSYSHQSAIADGIVPGAKVRQGQVIGYVGSTGLSTGPHLHYELRVNGNLVDPLRVRLPDSKSLEGEALAAFQRERKRVDDLLQNGAEDLQVASR